MKLVEDKGGAVALMIVALIFLGTWPALLNLLERRGRNPVHTYLDYSLTNFIMAIIIALTLGQIGDPKPGQPNFTTQLSQVCHAKHAFVLCKPYCCLHVLAIPLPVCLLALHTRDQ